MELRDAMQLCTHEGYIARGSKPGRKIYRAMEGFYEMPPTLPAADRIATDWECYE